MTDTLPGTHDILNCLANLSNDEVFTPPELANKMIDLLPVELFDRIDTTFLDPCCKSGVFLREIAKRLIASSKHKTAFEKENTKRFKGLSEAEKHQLRLDHIYHKQLFGIAITQLTALMSRRTLYCSKYPNTDYSISKFDDIAGNIRFVPIDHTWDKNGKCKYCGASQSNYSQEARGENRETHAYEFIHTEKPEELWNNMHFDVIIGNPPYQMSDGGYGASAIPIYQKFVQQAKKLNPHFLTMIIPARWFSGGRGLDCFREEMLNDNGIRVLCDFFNSEECFPGIDLSGGVCYFLWDRDNHKGICRFLSSLNGKMSILERPLIEKDNAFIRFNQAVGIVRKIQQFHEKSFSDLVSTQKPFGLRTYEIGSAYSKVNTIKLFSNKNVQKQAGFVSVSQITNNQTWVEKYKVYVSSAYGERGDFPYLVIGKPFIGEPMTCCSETYLVVGPFDSQNESMNVINYMQTRFSRFLILLKKNTQHAPKSVYQFVPMQDFSKPWTDAELYEKYGLTQDEIDFIESMIKPMA